ncbi:hypothetical protein DL771_001343 [Monosporascus sp. 5C6A]|nr:hypothetical protein DL771_001343 [Monosporascus sp. 5C6A]
MRFQFLKLAATGAALAQSRAHALVVERPGHRACAHMKRDVAILGGGSSGTYTAVRLQDSGKTVVVVEADDTLGGHTETYTDPVAGQRDDIGVLFFHDIPVVRDYFARFDIPLEILQMPPAPRGYYGQLLRFPELLEGFDKLPDPVPEDLLLPFGQFAEKYGTQDVVPMLALYGQGGLDYEKTTTLYILKYLGPTFVEGLTAGELTTARRNNQELTKRPTTFCVLATHRRLPGRDRLQIQPSGCPGPHAITPAPIDGMTDVKYGSGFHEMFAEEAKAAIIEDLAALAAAINSTSAEPQFVTFKAHTPFQSMVSKEDIADCFYKRLWELQGHRQTYVTGAAW